MSAQLLDGKQLAERTRAQVAGAAQSFKSAHGRPPGLGVILVGEDPASQIYVRNKETAATKAGFNGEVIKLSHKISQSELLATIERLNRDPNVDGILLQLPLPKHLDAPSAIATIDPDKDVDGLTPISLGRLLEGQDGLRPCTPRGCMRMLSETNVALEGKDALVIGRSRLVGKPMALMLSEINMTVTLAHSKTQNLPAKCAAADVLVVATGHPNTVLGSWIKPSAIVIDVGMNRTDEGKLVGDVEFKSAAERASWITPVPGGVGPMTIAMLLENTLKAAKRRLEHHDK